VCSIASRLTLRPLAQAPLSFQVEHCSRWVSLVTPIDVMPPPQDPQRSSPDSGRFGWRDFGPPA
jgi:hypothetical protein